MIFATLPQIIDHSTTNVVSQVMVMTRASQVARGSPTFF